MLNEDKDAERRSYLAPEWRNRIQDSGITYVLQIQIREWSEGDTYSLYNASRAWDGQDTPWLDLAVIRLLSVLQDDILNMTSFCVGNLPDCTLGFPEATSSSDFNVVPYVYKEAYKVNYIKRLFIYSVSHSFKLVVNGSVYLGVRIVNSFDQTSVRCIRVGRIREHSSS